MRTSEVIEYLESVLYDLDKEILKLEIDQILHSGNQSALFSKVREFLLIAVENS